MIDVKKLITGFLILAVAAVSSGLILTLVDDFSSVATNTTPQPIVTGNSPTGGTNAFLPTQADVQTVIASVADQLSSSTMIQSSTDPKNLTDVLATEFVNGIASANPNGPSGIDTSGNPIIATPDINQVALNAAGATMAKNLEIPNWDVEAASIPISVLATSNASATFQYGTAVNDVLSGHLNAQVQNIVSGGANGASASDLSYVQSQMTSALGDAASLKVPATAVAYQKSLIKVLVYQKNMLQLMQIAQTDPVRASLVFQEESQKFSVANQDFQNQAQKLANANVSLRKQTAPKSQNFIYSFIGDTFGIPQAQAFWPVFDPATWALITANEWQTIQDQLVATLKNTLLQILKNTIMAVIQQKVLVWVQGSGAPRFITNWGTTLINAAQTSALNYINTGMTCGIYPAYLPQIRANLKSFYLPDTNSCANQLASALGNNTLPQFYNNFASGGFVAFGATTLPSGNPYGAQFFAAQKVALTYQNTQAATALKTQTSGGFKGGEVCDDGSDPTQGQHWMCESPTDDYNNLSNSTCKTGYNAVAYDNNGLCGDGTQPVVTTPSAVTAFTLNSAVDATPKQIAAANDIAGILNAALGSLMSALTSSAINAAGQFVNQSLTSINSSSITGGGTPPPALPLSCSPSGQTIPSASASGAPVALGTPTPTSTFPVSVSAGGGTPDAEGNSPAYFWKTSTGATGTGSFFSSIFTDPGFYTITLTDSIASDAPATCSVTVQ